MKRDRRNQQIEAMKKVRKTWGFNPKTRLTDKETGKNGQDIYRRNDHKRIDWEDEND